MIFLSPFSHIKGYNLKINSLSYAVKRPGREADHSFPSTPEVNSGVAIPSLSHMSSCRGA
jgi:hypothetical protein